MIYFTFVMLSYCWGNKVPSARSKGQTWECEVCPEKMETSCTLLSPAAQVDHTTVSRPKPTPDHPLIYLSWSGCGVFIRRAHKHWCCHINQMSVCNCPPNGMRSYRFMELSGRLIPDWDNRVLMTPFIVVFFFFFFLDLYTSVKLQKNSACCRNRLHVAVTSRQQATLPVCQVKEK